MPVHACTPDDLPLLMEFYDIARSYQQTQFTRHWQQFDPAGVLQEIKEGRQWKMTEGDQVAMVFLTSYDDPVIWGKRNEEPSVYLHRIVTHPAFRGRGNMEKLVQWAREHGKALGKKFIRMDTWGDNRKLNDYYIRCGFALLEVVVPEDRSVFPAYYDFYSLSLLEMKID